MHYNYLVAPLTTIFRVMKAENISGIPVVEDSSNKLVGILTNRDVRFATNDTQLILKDPAPLTTISNVMGYRYYGKGSYIDLSSRTVVKTGTKRLEFNLGETLTSETLASISFRATRTDAVETSKTLRPNKRYNIRLAERFDLFFIVLKLY